MDAENTFTADQAAQIATALRREAGLEPQRFTAEDFVGMISDEVDDLRAKGKSDEEIASLIKENGANLSGEDIRKYYVPRERRQHG